MAAGVGAGSYQCYALPAVPPVITADYTVADLCSNSNLLFLESLGRAVNIYLDLLISQGKNL